MDAKLANAALDLASGFVQGAAKDRIVQAFFAGAVEANPDAATPAEIMAVAMSGATVVERWAGRTTGDADAPRGDGDTQGGDRRGFRHGPGSGH
jgi:hypothetical protein